METDIIENILADALTLKAIGMLMAESSDISETNKDLASVLMSIGISISQNANQLVLSKEANSNK
jgi:hypothetical protein